MYHSLLRLIEPGHRHLAQVSPDGLSTHFDLASVGAGTGYVMGFLTRSAFVTMADAKFDRPLLVQAEAMEDVLLVRAAMSTCCNYEPRGHTPWEFRFPEITVSTIPRGTQLDIEITAGRRQCALTVVIEPRTLFGQHGVVAEDLPPPLQHFMDRGRTVPVIETTLPMRPEIAALVDDLRHSRLTGGLRQMQVEGRTAELLALVASTWKSRLSTSHEGGLRGRDAELLANARKILLDRCTQPPKLQELASELGTNRTKINQLFRACIGVTPQEYTLHRRIERAQALIVEGRLNVGQIADAVGYQHQSSFTTAFREVTGMSPREFATQARGRNRERLAQTH
jgi:AraC-like DNA-binding protein